MQNFVNKAEFLSYDQVFFANSWSTRCRVRKNLQTLDLSDVTIRKRGLEFRVLVSIVTNQYAYTVLCSSSEHFHRTVQQILNHQTPFLCLRYLLTKTMVSLHIVQTVYLWLFMDVFIINLSVSSPHLPYPSSNDMNTSTQYSDIVDTLGSPSNPVNSNIASIVSNITSSTGSCCIICADRITRSILNSTSECPNMTCQHSRKFHKHCLIHWLDIKQSCPICRTQQPLELCSTPARNRIAQSRLAQARQYRALEMQMNEAQSDNSVIWPQSTHRDISAWKHYITLIVCIGVIIFIAYMRSRPPSS